MTKFYTAGDLTPLKCGACGQNLEVYDVDTAEGIVWLSCPAYTAGDDGHDSYSLPAALEVVVEAVDGYRTYYFPASVTEAEITAAAKRWGVKS